LTFLSCRLLSLTLYKRRTFGLCSNLPTILFFGGINLHVVLYRFYKRSAIGQSGTSPELIALRSTTLLHTRRRQATARIPAYDAMHPLSSLANSLAFI
jgi:hypothetical protein